MSRRRLVVGLYAALAVCTVAGLGALGTAIDRSLSLQPTNHHQRNDYQLSSTARAELKGDGYVIAVVAAETPVGRAVRKVASLGPVRPLIANVLSDAVVDAPQPAVSASTAIVSMNGAITTPHYQVLGAQLVYVSVPRPNVCPPFAPCPPPFAGKAIVHRLCWAVEAVFTGSGGTGVWFIDAKTGQVMAIAL